MGTFVYSSCLSWKNNLSRQVNPSHHVVPRGVPEKGCSRIKAAACSKEDVTVNRDSLLGFPGEGSAVVKQGLLAGRVAGLYEKSGGHGAGWSPMIPYTLSMPDNWEEVRIHLFTTYSGSLLTFSPVEQVPVSIADLGGTEIDLRFANPKEGRIFV
ncbi:hypothetical protein CQW23_25281 [Capsicum baccatum]|uniref:Uncharacterized protein n=1 Tax=Capsicum baccatum TaxID=33114 RepID=A0A2G2VKF6_CAPBA|nr:hypothetical protein CQW23_25281 [Capsicum baccatum]